MAEGDIFQQIGQLFKGEPVQGDVNTFVLHRFFASDPTYASAAKMIGNSIHDDKLITGIWAVSLPRLRSAPFFKYGAPKKPPAVEELVKKIAAIENYNLPDAEEVVQMIIATGRKDQALQHYGIDVKP